MSSLLTTLLMGGLIIGGAVVLLNPDNRCNYLGLCGQGAAAAPVVAGGVDESATNLDANGNWDDTADGKSGSGCCVCEMQGDRVKCQRHGGAWFNPPAGSGGSNDQSVELSLAECNKECGTSAPPQGEPQQAVRCPSGYNSINGKCTKITQAKSGTGKGTGQNASTAKKSSTPSKSSVTGSGQQIKPKAGTGAATYFNANPKGYKPGGGTYYTNAYVTMARDGHYYTSYSEEEIDTYDNRFNYYPNILPRVRNGRMYY